MNGVEGAVPGGFGSTARGMIRLLDRLGCLTALILVLVSWGRAEDRSGYPLAVPPSVLLRDEASFRAFAGSMRERIEGDLVDPAHIDRAADLDRLLAMRVHLALYGRDYDRAAATAAWIRSRRADAAARAFAGLTTFAAVAAGQTCPGAAPTASEFRRAFTRELAVRFAALPHTAAMVGVLREQRAKTAGSTQEELQREAAALDREFVAGGGRCSLAVADQIIRLKHRLTMILPLREELLEALDRAIGERG